MTKYFKDIFERDRHRCVYCGKWMLADFDTFMMTDEDHLLPLKEGGADDESNRVTCCKVCNMLKGAYCPGRELYNTNRAAYIQEIRNYIFKRRAEKLSDFFSWTHPNKDFHGNP